MSNVFVTRSASLEGRDYYPTPPWATRALFEQGFSPTGTIWEPANGGGHMSSTIAEYYDGPIETSDIITGHDFLNDKPIDSDWIITNPPFNLGVEFALRALDLANVGVAFFVRYSFLETAKRYNAIFKHNPPSKILQFSERVGFLPDRVSRKAPSAVVYVWIIWDKTHTGPTEFEWINNTKVQLEKDSDYD